MRCNVIVFVLLGTMGCATAPYQYGGNYYTCNRPAEIAETRIERGVKRPILDGIGWLFGIPGKIILLNSRIANHNVSPETETELRLYLVANDLDEVKVRLNQYDPLGEWERLRQNTSVGWPIRYTFGTLSVVGYTLLPGRLIGVDDYNPFTNTIHIYSDVPAVALYEGGRAKDYAQRKYKGCYALAEAIPVLPMFWHEARAANDAVSYIQENGNTQEVKEAYRIVCPLYAVRSCPGVSVNGVPAALPALVAGHAAGQAKAYSIAKNAE